MSEPQKTAAGEMELIRSAKCDKRGGTTMFLGRLPCGRFAVASRFQVELRTKNLQNAQRKFGELCNV